MIQVLENNINLCDSCKNRDDLPYCPAKENDILYGTGIGNDNICCCNKYCADTEKRHDDCPLIKVPEPHDLEVPEPHGWLILADELIEFIENRYEITWKDDYEGGIKDACVDILEKISTMPRYSSSESKERPVFLPQYELTPLSKED